MTKYKGTVFTYVDLWFGCRKFLKVAEEEKIGGLAYYSSMATIVFSAFCLEAYLNNLGPHYIPTWQNNRKEKGEIWLPPKKKLKLLANKLGFTPEFGQRPFQSFTEIFDYRNIAAHSKTISLEGEFSGEAPDFVTDLQVKATPKYARRYHEDTGKIIRFIHRYHIPDDEPFFTIGEAGWWEE